MPRIAVGQINTTVGNFSHNAEKIIDYTKKADQYGVELVCFPELAICGYPPLDLLDRPAFVDRNKEALHDVAQKIPDDLPVVVGYVERSEKATGKPLHNAAALLQNGKIQHRYYKTLLPTYEVFNEARYFEPGEGPEILELGDFSIAITLCEDVWNDPENLQEGTQPLYDHNPLEAFSDKSPDLLLNLAASPYRQGKERTRTKMMQNLARKYETTFVMSNMVGVNDSLIFDGTSLVVNSEGSILAQGKSFEEDVLVLDTDSERTSGRDFLSEPAALYRALQTGISNYVHKSGYTKVVLGLSGGIDSALTATLAADTLDPENVLGILMPSTTSTDSSVTDAQVLAENLAIPTKTIDISELFEDYLDLFSNSFDNFTGQEEGGIENKNQHRIRGNILTTLANKYGFMPLCPGNKTELALGYTTLYGDLIGLLAPLADVPKSTIYELAEWRNQQSEVIPREIIEKAPSAELALDQRDEEDLASYDILDEIIELYLEKCLSRDEIIEKGHEPEVIDKILQLLDVSEYKRKQAPTGLRVTSRRDFTGGRIVPEVHHFYEEEYLD